MSAYNDDNLHRPPPHYRANDEGSMYPHFPEMEPRLDMGQFPTSSSHIHPHPHPHPHPLFTRQENMNSNPNLNRSLDPQHLSSHHPVYQTPASFSNAQNHIHPPSQESPHAWPLYGHQVSQNLAQQNPGLSPISYNPEGYPSASPFPPTRLSPPPVHVQFKGPSSVNSPAFGLNHRPILAGSLDPTTGIFYRTPEHPRLRTAQACEKCRTRKAKCSGEHPSCKRCLTRGLVCEYAKEGRVRGPNKPKPGKNSASVVSATKRSSIISNNPPAETSPVISSHSHDTGRFPSRARAASAHSNSSGSSEHLPDRFLNSTAVRHSLVPSGIEGPVSPIFSSDGRGSSGPGYRYMRRDSLSLSEHRSSRPRPPDLHLDTTSNLFRLSGASLAKPASATRDVSSSLGGLLSSPFQRNPQHHDALQHYRSPTRETPFAGENGNRITHPHQHHEFAPPVNQAQILDFQRSSVFIHGQEANRDPANYSNASNADILNLDVPEMGADIGDEFIYPSQTETYVQQQHQRFQQRTVYERRGSSREDEEVLSIES